MKDNKIQITINGEEKNKSEIIYNNIIASMEKENISKEDQIEYLKSKISYLETNNRNKIILGLFLLFGLISFILGIFLMCYNLKVLGIIFLIVGFITPLVKLTTVIYKNDQLINSKYNSVEHLKSILNTKLK